MFVAFIFMWACTPSSLRQDNIKDVSKAVRGLPEADAVISDTIERMVENATLPDALQLPEEVALPDAVAQVQQVVDSVREKVDSTIVRQALAVADSAARQLKSVSADSIPAVVEEAAAKLKRDTTTMDSLELAIYNYNKVIDDSLALDSMNRMRKNGIDSPVKYTANDSLTYEAASGRAYLYGNSHVEYQNMDLKSEKIFMVLDSSLVHATGARDTTTGGLKGTPVFKMGSDTYENDTMAFNFKTKKGIITQVYTQQEDGYLTSELAKRGGNGELYLQHGRYTTCSDPHPDFYIAMSRAKVRPGKDVVFGPAYLVVCDVPLPLGVPYGFFPFTKNYSSGLIMPTYGDESDRGFYLRDGGYYFALSDKMDLKLLGEVFTKGSWGISASSNYVKRYKFRGAFYVSYQNSVTGEENMPDYLKTTDIKVNWNHNQDSKANPFSTFSARVNFSTTSYEQNNLTSRYNPQLMTQSTRTSSVSYNTRFSSLNMQISTSMNLSQNMRDSSISLSFPNLNVSVSQFYPLRRKKMAGKERWYEKIGMSYRGDFQNSINTKEDKLLHSDFRRDWRNKITHTIPINATFQALDVISITPGFSLTDVNSFIKTHKSWDTENQKEVVDTISGFYNIYNWNLSLQLSTKLYGFYIPSRKLFGDKIQTIRHVLTPTVSFSYAPDFSADRYGYYDTYVKTNSNGEVEIVQYSPYSVGSVSAPSPGKTGSVSFDLKNNLEMKIRDSEDSIKKVSLIDEFSARMSYNMAATRQPWSSLSTNIRLKLTKSYTFSMNAVFASYVYEADSVGATPHESDHTTYWGQGKIGRFQGMSQVLNYNLDNSKIINIIKWLKGERPKKKDDKDKKKKQNPDEIDDLDMNANVDREMEEAKRGGDNKTTMADTDEDGYMKFSLPWSLNFSYGITMREDKDVKKFNYETMRYPYGFTQTLSVGGYIRLSEGWNINFSSGYDFENHAISMTTASLSRDLHCFSMSCQVTLAPYTSYNFSFRCNASTLTDALKYDKRSGYTNSVQWY